MKRREFLRGMLYGSAVVAAGSRLPKGETHQVIEATGPVEPKHMVIHINGETFSAMDVRRLIEEINKGIDGGRVTLV